MKNKAIDWTKPLQVVLPNNVSINAYYTEDGSVIYRRVRETGGLQEWKLKDNDQHISNDQVKIRNAPEKKRLKGWANVYGPANISFWRELEQAKRYQEIGCIACVPIDIEYTEGEGLGDGE